MLSNKLSYSKSNAIKDLDTVIYTDPLAIYDGVIIFLFFADHHTVPLSNAIELTFTNGLADSNPYPVTNSNTYTYSF